MGSQFRRFLPNYPTHDSKVLDYMVILVADHEDVTLKGVE